MSVALIGRKAGMTRIFTDAGETVPVTVIEVLPNRITQVKSVDKDGYRAIQVTYGKNAPAAAVEGRRRSLRQGERRARQVAGRVPPHREGRRGPRRRAAEIKASIFEGGRRRRRHGHHHRQGLRRHDEAPQLRRPPRLARCLGVAPYAGLHRPAPDAGSRVPGQAHVRPHGRGSPHDREPESRRDRCRAQPAADQRRGAGRGRWPGHRASVGEGRAPRSVASKIAPAKQQAANDRQRPAKK